MKAAELREHAPDELWRMLEEANRELFNLRFQAASGQLSDPGRMREVRRDIARIKTVLRERELASSRVEEE